MGLLAFYIDTIAASYLPPKIYAFRCLFLFRDLNFLYYLGLSSDPSMGVSKDWVYKNKKKKENSL